MGRLSVTVKEVCLSINKTRNDFKLHKQLVVDEFGATVQSV